MKNSHALRALLTLCLFAIPTTGTDQKAADPIDQLQDHWGSTTSYQADFTQTIISKGSGLEEEPSSGTVYVVKPGKLRWEDKTAGVTQILSGKAYWDITENRRRKSRAVNHYPDVAARTEGSALKILAGSGKFKDFYKVRLLSDSAKEATLELRPKTGGQETLIAKIDKNGYVLRSLTTETPDSKVVVEFSNVSRNPSLPDKLFQYRKRPNDDVQVRKG